MSEDETRQVIAADPKAYRKAIAYDFPIPVPGGRPEDKLIKASPYLIKALKEKQWIDDMLLAKSNTIQPSS
jgi:hypothetical protein